MGLPAFKRSNIEIQRHDNWFLFADWCMTLGKTTWRDRNQRKSWIAWNSIVSGELMNFGGLHRMNILLSHDNISNQGRRLGMNSYSSPYLHLFGKSNWSRHWISGCSTSRAELRGQLQLRPGVASVGFTLHAYRFAYAPCNSRLYQGADLGRVDIVVLSLDVGQREDH